MRAGSLGRVGVMALFGCAGCGAVRYEGAQSMGGSSADQSAAGSSAAQATGGASAGSIPIDPEASAGEPSQGGAPFAGTCELTPADPAQTARYRGTSAQGRRWFNEDLGAEVSNLPADSIVGSPNYRVCGE